MGPLIDENQLQLDEKNNKSYTKTIQESNNEKLNKFLKTINIIGFESIRYESTA